MTVFSLGTDISCHSLFIERVCEMPERQMLFVIMIYTITNIACKDSYMVYACGFDQVGKREWFTESMRITTNTVIFMHLCHLALNHWRGDTLFFIWFLVICKPLWKHFWGDSQWFSNQSEIVLGAILSDSWWFSVICKPLWKHFWGDSQPFLVICEPLWKHFWGNSWWFSVIHESIVLGPFSIILSDLGTTENIFGVICELVWNCFWVILGDSQTTLKTFLGQFSMILGDLQISLKLFWGDSWFIFGVILGDTWISLKLFWGDSQWFLVIHEPFWKHFLGNSQWFVNQIVIVLGWFSVIHEPLKTFLEQFLVICEPFWNHFCGDSLWFVNHSENIFGVILDDSQWFMN